MFSSLPIFKRRPAQRLPRPAAAHAAASRLQAFAVEPRMLFDGAGVATAEVVDHAHAAAAAEAAHAPATVQADSRPIEARIAHAVEFKDSGGGGTGDSHAQADEKWINTGDQVKDGNVFHSDAGGHYEGSRVVGVQAGSADQAVHGGVDRTVSGRYGELTLYADGWYCYEVNDAGRALPAGERAQDSFSYSIANDAGVSTNTITVHLIGITQDAGNHDPVAAGNDRSVDQHAAITDGQVIQADHHGNPASTDADGGALEVTGVVSGQTGQVDRTGLNQAVQGQYGQLVMQSDGHYTYTPTAGLGLTAGQQVNDRFSYLLCDNQGGEAVGTIVVTVTGAGGGHHPGGGDHGACAIDAQPDEYWINNGDTITDGQAIRGDRDPATPWHHDTGDTGQNLHVVGVEAGHAPSGVSGRVGEPITGSFGTLVLNADGSYSYQVGPAGQDLAGGQRVQDVFTYTVADDCGGLATTTITVHLIGLNHNPTPVDHVRPIECDQTITDGQVLQADGHGNGADWDRDGDRLEIQGVVAGKPGEVPREHVGETVHGRYGDLVMNADGSYTYVPHAGLNVPEGQTLTDTFSYRLCDNKGGEAIGTVTITLTCCPDKPGNPGNPENPGNPGNPENPGNPGNPENPGNPGNPENPGNPGNPENPGNPGNPENPGNPGNPGNPENPGNPGNPENPGNPGNPENPGNPGGGTPPGTNPETGGGGGGSGPQVPPVPGGFDRPVTAPVVAPAPSYSGGVGSTPVIMAPLVVAPELVEPFRFQRVAGVSEEAPAELAPALLAAATKAVKPQDDCIPAVKPVTKAVAKPKPKVVASSVFAKPDVVDKKVPKTFSEQVKGAAKRMPVRHKAAPSSAPVDKGC